MAAEDHVFVNRDFLHCSICLETYDTPRSLPCLHTFCHLCLTGYIQKLLDKSGEQKLFCPVCRSDTKTDNYNFNSVEKWVKNFPVNFTLHSILNETERRMNKMENYCEPCVREETNASAIVYCYDCSEKLCRECKRHHKKSKLLSNHKLFEIGENSDTSDLKELEYLASLSKCPKHGSEEVKYLCKDHDQLCCNECAIVTHRKCEDMVSLADEVSKKDVTADIQNRVKVIENHAEKLIDHESTFVLGLTAKEKEIKNRLRQFKTDIDNAYIKLENRILSKMSSRKLKLLGASSIQKESAENLKDDIKTSAEKLKKTSELGTATHIFLVEREMAKQVKGYEERVRGIHQTISKTSLTLTETRPAQHMAGAIGDLFQVHEVIAQSDILSLPGNKDFKDRKLNLVKEFCIQENSQPRYCLWIGKCIVIAFEYLSKINVYDEKDGSILSSYTCPSGPTTLADLENGEMAVALPKSDRIDILKLENNRLLNVRTMVNSTAELIAYNKQDKQLFAMTRSERTIKRFYLDGKDVGVIRIDAGEGTLANAYNVTFDNVFRRLYITSHSIHKLLSLDMNGKVAFQYSIAYPWAVTTDCDGNVYVASYSQHEVHQLNSKGQLMRNLVNSWCENMMNPMGMCFNKDRDRIVITCNYIGSTNTRGVCMKLYQFE